MDEIHFFSAKKFMECLRLSNSDVWDNTKDNWHNRWIFRGHQDSRWKLMPTAHRSPRPPQIETYFDKYSPRVADLIDYLLSMPVELAEKSQPGKYVLNGMHRMHLEENRSAIVDMASTTIAENILAWEYADRLDSVGLFKLNQKVRYRPDDESMICNWMLVPGGHQYQNRYRNLWEFQNNPEAFILTQHHGLPTRLLDWTSRPYNAAFFAAEKLYELLDKSTSSTDKKICVWALDTTKYREFQNHPGSTHLLYRLDNPGLGASKYIHAQEGLFAFMAEAENCFTNHTRFIPMDESIEKAEEFLNSDISKKITLPYSECPELIRLLSLEGISKAKLMPSHDRVAESLSDQIAWDKHLKKI